MLTPLRIVLLLILLGPASSKDVKKDHTESSENCEPCEDTWFTTLFGDQSSYMKFSGGSRKNVKSSDGNRPVHTHTHQQQGIPSTEKYKIAGYWDQLVQHLWAIGHSLFSMVLGNNLYEVKDLEIKESAEDKAVQPLTFSLFLRENKMHQQKLWHRYRVGIVQKKTETEPEK